jgi:3-isopropylmalate/(R)-2-methylmalate dehydratase small subunit
MTPFISLTSRFIPLLRDDVNTDQIIPASYLKVTDKAGLAEGLFSSWCYHADGKPDPAFPLNQPAYRQAQILLVGDNFGCGSSREHAVWALSGWGLRAVISTSFADIFYHNALKNGLLPVVVDARTHRLLCDFGQNGDTPELSIDLPSQSLTLPGGETVHFPIDTFAKTCLLEGIDQLGYLLKHLPQVEAFERATDR